MEKLAGYVEHIIYRNADNGYTVLTLVSGEEEITCVGIFSAIAEGENIEASGDYTDHPTYGKQFKVESFEEKAPEDEEAIERYLGSGAIRGIGLALAARIVRRFKADTFRIIEEEPERLQTVKGITAKKAMELSAAFRELTGLKRVMEFLARYELPVPLAMQLYRAYGAQALPRLKEDPYLLTGQAYGVAFSTMDEIALSMGFDGDSPCRTQAALLYELQHNQGNGHVFLPREKLLWAAAQLIGLPPDRVEMCLDTMVEQGAIRQEQVAGVLGCYTPELYEAECFVANKLLSMLRFPYGKVRGVDGVIEEMEMTQGIRYAPLQREAVTLAAQSGVLLLTGGPGTGKTTATRAIVHLFEKMGLDILLLAPTGRAAKRMGELCEREAQTIHRCLGMSYNDLTGRVTYKKGESDPLEAEAVLVDEMSMVDLPLMQALLCGPDAGW